MRAARALYSAAIRSARRACCRGQSSRFVGSVASYTWMIVPRPWSRSYISQRRGRLVVALDRLREDPHNERQAFHHMEGLTDSIREHGIIEPITVTPDGDHYRILTGHRRYRAARAAGMTEVEILIREPEEESHRRIKSLISNIQWENLSAIDLAEALHSVMAEDPTIISCAELGRRIGKSKQ